MADPTPRPAPSFDDPNSSSTNGGGGSGGPAQNPIFGTLPTNNLPVPSYAAGSTVYGSSNGQQFMTVPHDPTAPKVYFGPQMVPGAMSEHGGGQTQMAVDDIRSYEDGLNDIYGWSARHRRAMGNKMYAMHLIQSPTDYDGMNQVWNAAVKESAMRYTVSGGKVKVTPYDMIDAMAGLGNNGSPYANQTITRTHTSTQIITPETADAAIRNIFQQEVGRDPTKGELSKYRATLTGYSQSHPQVTKETTKYDAHGGAMDTSSVTTGGADAGGMQDVATQQLRQNTEYGTYQAATTYYNALMQAVGGG